MVSQHGYEGSLDDPTSSQNLTRSCRTGPCCQGVHAWMRVGPTGQQMGWGLGSRVELIL